MSSEEMRIELEQIRQQGPAGRLDRLAAEGGGLRGGTDWPDNGLPFRCERGSCRLRRADLPGRDGRHICLAALAVLREEDSGKSPMCVPMGTVSTEV